MFDSNETSIDRGIPDKIRHMECYTHGTDFRNFYWEGNQGWKILSSFSYVTCCLPLINNLWSDVDDISSPGQSQVDQALIQFIFFLAIPTCSNTFIILRHTSTFTFSHTLEGFYVWCEWTYISTHVLTNSERYPGICWLSLTQRESLVQTQTPVRDSTWPSGSWVR